MHLGLARQVAGDLDRPHAVRIAPQEQVGIVAVRRVTLRKVGRVGQAGPGDVVAVDRPEGAQVVVVEGVREVRVLCRPDHLVVLVHVGHKDVGARRHVVVVDVGPVGIAAGFGRRGALRPAGDPLGAVDDGLARAEGAGRVAVVGDGVARGAGPVDVDRAAIVDAALEDDRVARLEGGRRGGAGGLAVAGAVLEGRGRAGARLVVRPAVEVDVVGGCLDPGSRHEQAAGDGHHAHKPSRTMHGLSPPPPRAVGLASMVSLDSNRAGANPLRPPGCAARKYTPKKGGRQIRLFLPEALLRSGNSHCRGPRRRGFCLIPSAAGGIIRGNLGFLPLPPFLTFLLVCARSSGGWSGGFLNLSVPKTPSAQKRSG